ncbi:hypothetical protein RN001_002966 [Aquatica leii]|uniref:Lipase n=1 Tax=Aquatica leii TaxID=1421715 RepID=A0AAN7SSX9_9COLE|nr:hypothetical protein RN001_002966 [Aquatica leii]
MFKSEIARRWGYPIEVYHTITEDGYILTLFRIPYGKYSSNKTVRPPVLLQHGAILNSASFVNRGNKSLGFILADAGYDVWLGNFRGTLYSKKHILLNSKDRQFWEFDTYELGVYDTPAKINFIYKITKQQIIYIGHSLGTTTAYIHGVTSPHTAKEKLKIIISLAPTLYVKNWQSVTKYFFPIWKYAKPLILALTNGEVYLRGWPDSSLRETLCTGYPFQMYICQFFDMLVTGFNYEQNDPETLPITIIQNADATSYRTLSHCMQLVEKGNFDYYDFGTETNIIVYGSRYPPQYNLSLLQVPTYLIRAENDLLITKNDVELIHKNLPQKANPYNIFTIEHKSFNHEDFITARDVVPLLYNHLLYFLNNL